MTASLSTKAKELINRPVLANVATVDEHDHPQLTPVWIDLEDGELVFNTAKGRAKDRNLARNPSVAVSVVDPDDPYNVVVVRGKVEPTEEGADAHIDSLGQEVPRRRQVPDAPARRSPDQVPGAPSHVVMQPGDQSSRSRGPSRLRPFEP